MAGSANRRDHTVQLWLAQEQQALEDLWGGFEVILEMVFIPMIVTSKELHNSGRVEVPDKWRQSDEDSGQDPSPCWARRHARSAGIKVTWPLGALLGGRTRGVIPIYIENRPLQIPHAFPFSSAYDRRKGESVTNLILQLGSACRFVVREK